MSYETYDVKELLREKTKHRKKRFRLQQDS